jgi:hypothetical protein
MLLTGCSEEEETEAALVPEIETVQPASGRAGDVITVTGRNFSSHLNNNLVSFNGWPAEVASAEGDHTLKVTVPKQATTGIIAIAVNEYATEGPVFTIVDETVAPEITSVSTSILEPGQTFIITGKNFLTGNDAVRNIVRIGNIRASLLRATDSKLTLTVPAGITGDNVKLTVSIGETVSNAIIVSVNSFSSTLYWALIPNINIPMDGFQQFIVSGSADGSNTQERPYFSIPDDTADTKETLRYPLYGGGYAPSENLFYAFNSNLKVITKFSHGWNDLQDVYQPSLLNFFPAGPFAVMEGTNDIFFFGNDGSSNALYRGNKTDATKLSSKSFIQPSRIQVGDQAIYVLDGGTVFQLQLPGTSFDPLDLSVLPPVISGGGLVDIQYSNERKKLYLLYKKEGTSNLALYAWDDVTAQINLVYDQLPAGTTNLKIAHQQNGLQLYYTAPDVPIVTSFVPISLWMLNLRPNENELYSPIPVHRNITIIKDRTETNGTSLEKGIAYNGVSFLTIDDL